MVMKKCCLVLCCHMLFCCVRLKMDPVCRCCLGRQDLEPLFCAENLQKPGISTATMFTYLTSTEYMQSDLFSNFICIKCKGELTIAYNFLVKCNNSIGRILLSQNAKKEDESTSKDLLSTFFKTMTATCSEDKQRRLAIYNSTVAELSRKLRRKHLGKDLKRSVGCNRFVSKIASSSQENKPKMTTFEHHENVNVVKPENRDLQNMEYPNLENPSVLIVRNNILFNFEDVFIHKRDVKSDGEMDVENVAQKLSSLHVNQQDS